MTAPATGHITAKSIQARGYSSGSICGPFAEAGVTTLLAHATALASLPPLNPRLRFGANSRIAGVLLRGETSCDEAHAAG